MKTELEEIKKELESTLDGFKDAYEDYGYDLANERHYVETAMKQVNLLLLHNVSNSFSEWWHNSGSSIRPNENDDYESHAKRVCEEFIKALEK